MPPRKPETRKRKESEPELPAPDNLQQKLVPELKEICKSNGISSSGTKDEIIYRLNIFYHPEEDEEMSAKIEQQISENKKRESNTTKLKAIEKENELLAETITSNIGDEVNLDKKEKTGCSIETNAKEATDLMNNLDVHWGSFKTDILAATKEIGKTMESFSTSIGHLVRAATEYQKKRGISDKPLKLVPSLTSKQVESIATDFRISAKEQEANQISKTGNMHKFIGFCAHLFNLNPFTGGIMEAEGVTKWPDSKVIPFQEFVVIVTAGSTLTLDAARHELIKWAKNERYNKNSINIE